MLYFKASQHRIEEIDSQAVRILGKHFIRYEWLPNNLQFAKQKCRDYLESNFVCILVEFSDRFGIYHLNSYEDIDTVKSSNNLENLLTDNTKLDTFEDFWELVEKIAVNLNINSAKKFRGLLSQKLILDREIALQVLEESLTKCIGPIAGLIYQEAIEEVGKVETFADFASFFKRLASEIEDAEYREQFQNIVSRNLILDRNLALKIIRSSLEQVTGHLGSIIDRNVLEE